MSGARRIFLAIAILSAAGIVDSGISLRNHYRKDASTFCDLNQNFNCDIVNRSSYSRIAGIPVALLGLLGYAGLAGISIFYRREGAAPGWLAGASLAGLAFALYLTYIEGWVLGVWCVLCLASLALITLITLLSAALWWHSRRVS